jgi:hypothetical protein
LGTEVDPSGLAFVARYGLVIVLGLVVALLDVEISGVFREKERWADTVRLYNLSR